jgi:hypothetical protein
MDLLRKGRRAKARWILSGQSGLRQPGTVTRRKSRKRYLKFNKVHSKLGVHREALWTVSEEARTEREAAAQEPKR